MRTRTVNFGILLQEQQGETKYKHMCLIFISNSSNTDTRKKAKISCSPYSLFAGTHESRAFRSNIFEKMNNFAKQLEPVYQLPSVFKRKVENLVTLSLSGDRLA